jgi:hypothetical protein
VDIRSLASVTQRQREKPIAFQKAAESLQTPGLRHGEQDVFKIIDVGAPQNFN